MIYYLIICRSLTYAQKTARALERTGISAVILRTPQNLAVSGCGYCVKVSGKRFTDALIALKNTDLYPIKAYAQYTDGSYGEVGV